jgi:hypothetical protein
VPADKPAVQQVYHDVQMHIGQQLRLHCELPPRIARPIAHAVDGIDRSGREWLTPLSMVHSG